VSTQTLELEATLGRDGRYRLESVLPGEWAVIWAPFEGGAQDVRSVVVPEGRQTVLDLRYEGVSIEGFVLDPDGMPARRANVTVFPERKTVRTDENGRFEVLGLQPGRYQLRARLMDQRSVLVEVVLYDSSDREVVQLVLEEDPPAEELVITLRGGGSGFCFVEMDRATQHIVRLDSGVARVRPAPPLPDRVRVACQTEGQWILDAWQDLKRAIEEGVSLDRQDSTSSIHLVAASSPAKVQIVGPGGWDLGRLRLWFGGASTFSGGETISNLPVGEYTLRWNGQARTVRTERRRTSEVELGGE